MANYEILIPANLAEKCFLLDALYWRAFGRAPIEYHTLEDPWIDSEEVYDGASAPVPSPPFIEEAECVYAGLPPDPRERAAYEDHSTNIESAEKMLDLVLNSKQSNETERRRWQENLEDARQFQREYQDWKPQFEIYVDEFMSELCLDLRRGNLHAFGRKLPTPNLEEAQKLLEAEEQWLGSLAQEPVPSESWVSQHINWSEGAIYGPHASYIWIYLNVAEVLERYPPQTLITSGSAYQIGGSVAVSGYQPSSQAKTAGRGRPPLPWDDFHVEVARLYAEGEMPAKKEAAIALLREWFSQHKQKDVSRSAIGAKLKPYFDKIGRK